MKHKDLIAAFIGRTLNKSAEEVTALLIPKADDVEGSFEPTVLDELLKHDATRVQGFTAKNKEHFDNGYKKAQVEALSKFEGDLKEKFKFTEDKKGLDLIEAIVMGQIKANGGDLDDDKIKRSKVYLDAIEKYTKEKEDAIKTAEDKYKTLEGSIQKETLSKSVREQAKAIILELQPVLPEGKTPDGKLKADIQINKLIDELLATYDYQIEGDKTLIIKDGKVLEDIHSHMVDFKKFVGEKAAERWDFKEGEARKGTGNSNEDDEAAKAKGAKKYSGPAITNVDDYTKAMGTAKTDDEKIEITKEWNNNPANTFN